MDSILEEFNKNKFESLVSDTLVNHLKCLNKDKKYPNFHETLNNILGYHLNDETFIKWLANKLNIRPSKFTIYVKKWRDNSFQKTRGRQEQTDKTKNIRHMDKKCYKFCRWEKFT